MNKELLNDNIDKLSRFFCFNRNKISLELKENLQKHFEEFDNLTKSYKNKVIAYKELDDNFKTYQNKLNICQEKFNNLDREYISLNDNFNKTQKNLIDCQNRYSLVQSFLNAKSIDNESFRKFKTLISKDFLDFANSESSLAEEAKALLMMQDIEKRLSDIVSFSSIYNKNIVAVGGGFSAGKSEFLNSFFIDNKIKLPVGINPVTAIPTYITSGNKNLIKGYSYKGGVVEISPETYAMLSHDFIKSLGFNLKDIAPIMAIETPIEYYDNICFIDTPGYNPANSGFTGEDDKTAKEYLEHANTLLWVIGVDTNGTIPNSDIEFLESMMLEDKEVYIIANKADLRSSDDIEDILDLFEEILDEYDIKYKGISAYSSIMKKEISYREQSLFDFLQSVNNPINVQESIVNDLNKIFDMYKIAIEEQIKFLKKINSEFKSFELDLLEHAIENEKLDQRIEKMRTLFSVKKLNKQLKQLEELRIIFNNTLINIFKSIE